MELSDAALNFIRCAIENAAAKAQVRGSVRCCSSVCLNGSNSRVFKPRGCIPLLLLASPLCLPCKHCNTLAVPIRPAVKRRCWQQSPGRCCISLRAAHRSTPCSIGLLRPLNPENAYICRTRPRRTCWRSWRRRRRRRRARPATRRSGARARPPPAAAPPTPPLRCPRPSCCPPACASTRCGGSPRFIFCFLRTYPSSFLPDFLEGPECTAWSHLVLWLTECALHNPQLSSVRACNRHTRHAARLYEQQLRAAVFVSGWLHIRPLAHGRPVLSQLLLIISAFAPFSLPCSADVLVDSSPSPMPT